ncbi:hypothetical protein BDV29DRAFT_35847 [Aspergillus leporis]|uniref:Uncharacterized protein n=1 Tax=Aspergillus leporis TaxID=41062 RepID=A0A5N5XAV6_9EURO|nr:hypothetical protein BDV29DRAFT_35847 [Aspergillus leporis]
MLYCIKSLHHYMAFHFVRFSDEFLTFYALQIDTNSYSFSLFLSLFSLFAIFVGFRYLPFWFFLRCNILWWRVRHYILFPSLTSSFRDLSNSTLAEGDVPSLRISNTSGHRCVA